MTETVQDPNDPSSTVDYVYCECPEFYWPEETAPDSDIWECVNDCMSPRILQVDGSCECDVGFNYFYDTDECVDCTQSNVVSAAWDETIG